MTEERTIKEELDEYGPFGALCVVAAEVRKGLRHWLEFDEHLMPTVNALWKAEGNVGEIDTDSDAAEYAEGFYMVGWVDAVRRLGQVFNLQPDLLDHALSLMFDDGLDEMPEQVRLVLASSMELDERKRAQIDEIFSREKS